MHRLFVAFPLPDEAATVLSEWSCAALAPGQFRFLAAKDLHVTVAFYAKATEPQRQRLVELVQASQFSPLLVHTTGIRRFGKSALAVTLARRFRPVHDDRPTDPEVPWAGRLGSFDNHLHVTVARISRVTRYGQAPAEREAPPVPKLEFVLDRVALYESHLDPAGSRYEIIAGSPQQSSDTPPES